ncbi:hypothetical protein DFJ73DRAFT_808190 [Zopfochytrium polystomum]|nr:hypothetical protein DFJ73DRAFT_808190 [Zopfochytrium polystomum]
MPSARRASAPCWSSSTSSRNLSCRNRGTAALIAVVGAVAVFPSESRSAVRVFFGRPRRLFVPADGATVSSPFPLPPSPAPSTTGVKQSAAIVSPTFALLKADTMRSMSSTRSGGNEARRARVMTALSTRRAGQGLRFKLATSRCSTFCCD